VTVRAGCAICCWAARRARCCTRRIVRCISSAITERRRAREGREEIPDARRAPHVPRGEMDSAASITGPASDAERPPMVRVAGTSLAQIPALYVVALAILTGDAAGSMSLGIPLWLA